MRYRTGQYISHLLATNFERFQNKHGFFQEYDSMAIVIWYIFEFTLHGVYSSDELLADVSIFTT